VCSRCKDDLKAPGGRVYALEFDHGVTKIGKSANKSLTQRLYKYQGQSRSYQREIVQRWMSPSLTQYAEVEHAIHTMLGNRYFGRTLGGEWYPATLEEVRDVIDWYMTAVTEGKFRSSRL